MIIERGLGGAATVLLGAIGFVLALGHYDVSAYLWLEGAFVFGTLVLIALFFSRSARPLLAKVRPLLVRLRVERPLRSFYDGVHHYRGHPGLLLKVFLFTTAIQAVRILSIWASCKAVGIDLSPRIYYVMGPLFFLVLLVPFTLNGFAVREAFFVSFLGSVGVSSDAAFAAGFLFFLVTVVLAAAGRLRSCSGSRFAAGRAPRWGMAECGARLTSASSSRPTTPCRGSSSASRASRASTTVVVDNDSSDGTVAFVRERFPAVSGRRAGEPRPRRRLGARASRSSRRAAGR